MTMYENAPLDNAIALAIAQIKRSSFADKKKMASNKKFLSCEFRTKQKAITRLYKHVIIGNKVLNAVLVFIYRCNL